MYKKVHTIPGISLDTSVLFSALFITELCLTSPKLMSVQRTGKATDPGMHRRTLPRLEAVPGGQWLGMGAFLQDDQGKTGQILVWLLLLLPPRGE